MSGHSKWATIKHKKGAQDKARGKLFAKLIRQIEVSAREGGGDIDANPTLRTMYEKARSASVPMDTITPAIERGTGELEGVTYEAVTYEGYAPCGVAVYVEALTDNRNRTGADVRGLFTRNGGSTAEPGAVSWQFHRKGVIILPRTIDEDELMLVAMEAGAGELAGAGTVDVGAVLADLGAVDPDVFDAGAAGDEAVGAGGEVPDPFELGDADGVGVEGDEVGRQAFLHQAPVGDAEDLHRLTGEAPDRLLEGQHAL